MTRRVTDDGWEEEVYEEWEEEEVKVKSTTIVTAADSEERERVAGGVTSKQTSERVASDQSSRWRVCVTFYCIVTIICSRVKDGKILEVKNSSDRKIQNKEIIIPIQVSESHKMIIIALSILSG